MRAIEFAVKCTVLTLLPSGLAPVTAVAQLTDTGSIVGTVQDQRGAAIPGAKITVTNIGTNVQQVTTTDVSSQYVVPSLKVATYSLTVEKTGFQTFVHNGIIVDVQSRIQVDVTLQLGAMTERVEVTGAPSLLHTQTAEVGQVVESKRMEDLPLNGRNYDTLAYLTAGVFIPTGNLTTSAGEGYYNINGNSAAQNNYILDGADNNSFIESYQGRSAQAGQPPVDALAEFKVQTRTYDTEFGRSAGGVINAQIKSGTNVLHGAVWEFLRNSKLDTNDFFLNRAGASKPQYQRNQYGGTLGGPILKDKAFVFGAFEGTRIRQGVTLLGSVPTPLMRQLNFSELPSAPHSPTVPALSQFSGCINNSIVTPSCVDPVSAKLFGLYPLPNTNLGQNGIAGGFVGNNFISSPALSDDLDNGVIRADQKIGEKDSLYQHYSVVDERFDYPTIFQSVNPIADGDGNFQLSKTNARRQSAAVGMTHIFSPTTLLDLRAGWNRLAQHSKQLPFGQDVTDQFGLKGLPKNPVFTGGLPELDITGFNQLGSLRWQPLIEISYAWDFRGILTRIKGAHTIKAGLEGRRDGFNYLDDCCVRGYMTFNGQYTGQGVTDFLLGTPNHTALTSLSILHKYVNGIDPFVQDTWRITPKLTVNYGLRWEYVTPFLERNNYLANFNPNAKGGQGVMFTATNGGVAQRSTVNPYYGGFAPRIGLAYSITDKLVFRSGYGVFYENYDRRGNLADIGLNPPFFVDHEVTAPTNAGPPFLLQNGFASNWLAPPDITNPSALSPLFLRAIDPNIRSGMIQQTGGGFEYSIKSDLLFSATWVGNYGHRLWRGVNINQKVLTTPGQPSAHIPFPAFRVDPTAPPVATLPTPIQQLESNGNSNYNAALISLEKRFSRGLSFLISYTISKNITDFSPEFESAAGPINTLGRTDNPQNGHNLRAEKGLANQDTPQRLVVSYSYVLPVGKGGSMLNSGFLGRVLQQWQFNGIGTFQSGQPVSILAAIDTSQTGAVRGEPRANCIKRPANITRNVDQDFDVTAFAEPSLYTFGSCSVSPGPRTRGVANFDMSLSKQFPVTETKRVEFRAEFFNIFNHTQFGPPGNLTVGTPGFGAIISVAVPPREIQFALKLYF